MKLRTFLIALLVSAVVALVTVYTQRAGRQLQDGFAEIDNLQRHSVARYASTVVAAHRYLARSAQRRLEGDVDLGKRALGAAPDALAGRAAEIRKETQADVARVVPLLGAASDPFIPPVALAKVSRGESLLTIIFQGTEPWLVGTSPLRLYEDIVGVLVLGFRLNGAIAEEIAGATRTRAYFAAEPASPDRLLLVPVTEELALPLAVKGDFLRGLTQATRESVLFWGIACLLCVMILIYGLLEIGFVRKFRRLVGLIRSNARALDEGEIREFPSRAGSVLWELRALWEAMHAYTASLQNFRRKVEEKSRTEAMGRIAAQVAHDLRAPLAALQVCLTDDVLQSLPEANKSLLQAATTRMRGIVDDLRERDRVEAVQEVRLVPLVQEMVSEKHAQYRARPEVAIELDIAAVEARVKLQPTEFRRVLSNLVDNSLQAMHGPGTVRVRVAPSKSGVDVEVEDTGKGIPPEIRERLFERGATHGKEDGTGLGLWHARESARAWGAEIALDSKAGAGTRVTLSFPFLAALVLWLAVGAATARAASLADAVVHHQIVVSGSGAAQAAAPEPALVLELLPDEKRLGLDRAYLERVIRFKFASAKVPLRIAPPGYREAFLAGKIPAEEALRPKLAITFQLASGATGIDSVLEIELASLRYEAKGGRYVLAKGWQRRHRLTGLSGMALEETVTRLLQREVAGFLKQYPFAPSPALVARPTGAYRLEYRDEESLSSLGSLGLTAGFPLPVSARAAFWGSVRFPIVLGVSGMYLGSDTRGVLFDAGYAFERVGKTKHVASLAFARLNETWRREAVVPMERGLTSTRVETFQTLRSFLGPTYTLQWGDFVVTAGGLFPLEAGPDWRMRFLVQIGYAPLWMF